MGITTLTEVAEFPVGRNLKEMLGGNRGWGYEIALGQMPGTTYIEKHGMNEATAAGDAIETESGPVVIRTTAETIELISGDVGDDAGGAGAEAFEAFGVDINWNPISEIIAMNGQSASLPSSQEFLYVYRVKIRNSGATFNLGIVTVREAGAGATMAIIPALYGITQKCVFPVFAGCKLFLHQFRMEGSKSGTLTGELNLVEYELGQGKSVRHPIVFEAGTPHGVDWFDSFKIINEKTLIWVEAKSISAGATITASFDGIMMRYEDTTP